MVGAKRRGEESERAKERKSERARARNKLVFELLIAGAHTVTLEM